MPLAKCERCDELFDKVQGAVCTSCMPDEEAEFDMIRDCLQEHPDMSAEGLAELAGVELKVVKRMLDQGLISSTAGSSEATCGRCGAPAISQTKKLCHSCLEDLNRGVAKQRKNIALGTKKEAEVGEYGSVRQMLEQKRR